MPRTEADILARFDRLRAARAPWDAFWQDTADHVRPLRADFTGMPSPGTRRDRKIYDNTPSQALEHFAGGVYGLLTNPADKWFSLRFTDHDLNDWQGARLWLDEVTRRILTSFQPGASRFYAVVQALYMDWAAFGTGVFYSEDIPDPARIYDSVRPLGECYIACNAHEEVDTVYRLTRMTARQLVMRFAKAVPVHIRQAYDNGEGEASFEILHAVERNLNPGPKLARGAKPWTATYVERESGALLSSGGYDEFPYQVPRWSVAGGEVYGRPKDILADVKMLHEMNRTLIIAAQRAAEPPLLAYKENRASPVRMYSGGITYGAVTADGRSLIQPFQSGARLEITVEMIRERREAIREALFHTLLMMAERPNMTATEILERQEEKMRLLGPNLGRLQTEFLSPLIRRRFGILWRKGALPPAPPELEGHDIEIDYVSPLAKAARMSEATSVNRWLGSIAPLAEVQPDLLDKLDGDAALDVLAEGFCVPTHILRGKEDVAAIRTARAAMQIAAEIDDPERDGGLD